VIIVPHPADQSGLERQPPEKSLAGYAFLQLIHHAIEIGIASAKASGEPVSTALGDGFAVGDHLELTGIAGRNHRVNAKPLLDQGHETRDLRFIVPSSGAGTYLYFHCDLHLYGVP